MCSIYSIHNYTVGDFVTKYRSFMETEVLHNREIMKSKISNCLLHVCWKTEILIVSSPTGAECPESSTETPGWPGIPPLLDRAGCLTQLTTGPFTRLQALQGHCPASAPRDSQGCMNSWLVCTFHMLPLFIVGWNIRKVDWQAWPWIVWPVAYH